MRSLRLGLLAGSAGALLLTAGGAELVHGATEARAQLEGARASVPALRAALEAGDGAEVRRAVDELTTRSSAARRATDGPLWDAARWVPVAGRTPNAVQALTRSVDDLARDVLPGLADAALDVAATGDAAAADGLDLTGLAQAAPVVEAALRDVRSTRSRLAAVERRLVAGSVVAAHDDLAAELEQLEQALATGSTATRLLVPMLGAEGPRHYFVAFQTNAEARGTGGLVGAYGVLVAERGRLRFDALGDDGDLIALPPPQVGLGEQFEALHGPHHRLWQNTNTTAHFPYAAQLWLDMWEQATGQRLDGALATDPVALARLLAAVGPVDLTDGEQVSADNAVALTMRDAYSRFATDNDGRKDYLVGVAAAVADSVLGGGLDDPRRLLDALRDVTAERRLLVYSAHPPEQDLLSGTSLSGTVPDAAGPFVSLVVNNGAGNKMDYYLRRSLRYELGPCREGWRESVVRVALHNDAPAEELPSYVTARLDRPEQPQGDGSTRLNVAVYAARGATLSGAVLDGEPVDVQVHEERGHPVLVLPVELGHQQRRELVLRLVEPVVDAAPVVLEQPLVQPQTTAVRQSPCSA